VVPLIDARRDEVYLAAYQFVQQVEKTVIAPTITHVSKLKSLLSAVSEIHFVGTGAEKHQEYLKSQFTSPNNIPRSNFLSSEMCKLAYREFKQENYILDLQQLIPVYIRKPDAEKNEKESQNKHSQS
jgi:tRNA A37 threonylcarbamoyladenosine modification protein TsaB